MKLYTSGTFYSPIVADGDLMRDVMVAAIEADRAQRQTAAERIVTQAQDWHSANPCSAELREILSGRRA